MTYGETFTLRLPGLKTDYKSYALYIFSRSVQGPPDLLDASALIRWAQTVLSTVFLHFVAKRSAWIAQPLGIKDLKFGPVLATMPNCSMPTILDKPYNSAFIPPYSTTPIHATIDVPIQQLDMSSVAVFLCLVVLVILAVLALLVYVPYIRYFKALPWDVETLASQLGFICDTSCLKSWMIEHEQALDTIANTPLCR